MLQAWIFTIDGLKNVDREDGGRHEEVRDIDKVTLELLGSLFHLEDLEGGRSHHEHDGAHWEKDEVHYEPLEPIGEWADNLKNKPILLYPFFVIKLEIEKRVYSGLGDEEHLKE
jgi:hypothetical protein